MATFEVDRVTPAKKPLARGILEDIIIKNHTGRAKPESFFKPSRPLVRSFGNNSFIGAVNTAFDGHYPLVLSPDAIWMLIAQGFSRHVNANSEKLRSHFVEHEGKKELVVRRDDFVKGSADNPWPEVFSAFSDQIESHVGPKVHSTLTPDFTTTGPAEKAASQVVLMDTFKEYFEYTFMTLCGIPKITLEGTVDDWKKLRDKALALAEFDLAWWTDELKPVLEEFVNAASGRVNRGFWSKIYKEADDSGGPFVSGWILTLFPYVGTGKDLSRNSYLKSWKEERTGFSFGGFESSSFSRGTVSTPFNWEYFDTTYPMHFFAGFMGVSQDPKTLALRPEIGWAVADDDEVKRSAKSPDTMLGWS